MPSNRLNSGPPKHAEYPILVVDKKRRRDVIYPANEQSINFGTVVQSSSRHFTNKSKISKNNKNMSKEKQV